MKPQSFTIDCSPATFFKCRVFVHPNRSSLLKNRNSGAKRKSFGCEAFCRQFGADDAWGNKELLRGFVAEMHFNRKRIKLDWVVHEAVHAAIAWSKLVMLDINTRQGDEAFADSVEHLTSGTLWQLRQMKIKV